MTESKADAMGSAVHTYCRLCPSFCGVVVDVDGDRVLRVRGDTDHPLSMGYTCSKGRALPEYHHDPQRIVAPLIRRGDEYRRSSWDEALGYLAERLDALRQRFGPESIGVFQGTHAFMDAAGRAVAQQFFGTLKTPQLYSAVTLDAPSKTLVPDLVAGTPFAFFTIDWEEADLVILIGINPVVSHGHTAGMPRPRVKLRALRDRGGSLVVVDPRQTETARFADLHLPARPGTDCALLAFLVRSTLRGAHDEAYLSLCADADSVERLRAAVEPFDLARTAQLCGVDEGDLGRLRDVVRGAGRVAIATGTGVSMGQAPNATEWLAWALGAATGSLDRRGGILFNPWVLRPQEQRLTTRPRFSKARPAHGSGLAHQYGEYPATTLPDEIAAGELRALFVLGGNPAVVMPEMRRATNALSDLELLVVCDVRRTETTSLADVVLPVENLLERADLTSHAEFSFPRPFVQYTDRVVAPLHDSRPMWQVFAELGGRLGLFDPSTIAPDEETVLASLARNARVTWEQIKAAPSGLVDSTAPEPGWFIPGRLPRGCLDLAPAELIDELRRWLARAGETPEERFPFQLINRRLPHQANTMLRDAPSQNRAPHPTLLMHPDDAGWAGLNDGDKVIITSRHGRAEAALEVTSSIHAGVVSLPHGWAHPGVNQLTSATEDVDPLTGMLRFSGVPVDVVGGR